MSLKIRSRNIYNVIKLYKKCGFIETGVRHNALRYDDGTCRDEILMYKDLT